MKKNKIRNQLIALVLTVVTCVALVGLYWLVIVGINAFSSDDISLRIRFADVAIGLTIYLKTSIDFAIFIGRLMEKNRGLKGRIGIEIGTALGNAAGTMAILVIWSLFKEVSWLLAIMILLAALVLIRLAEDGLEHINAKNPRYPKWFSVFVIFVEKTIMQINKRTSPLLGLIIPSNTLSVSTKRTFLALMSMSFTVPFLLGLDDFAGYVPLFNVVNVFGFGIGVFVGHMLLNVLLYISPEKTISVVKNALISFFGSLAFMALAVWGLIEAVKLIFGHHG